MSLSTIPTTGLWGAIAGLLNNNFAQLPPNVHCDYSVAPSLSLTPIPTLITGWFKESSNGISEDSGVFTVDGEGGWANISLERIYLNEDINPNEIVSITIKVEADPTGVGDAYGEIFKRTAIIGAATHTSEPATLSFLTPTNLQIVSGTKFRILVSAEDGTGITPASTTLSRAKVVAHMFRPLD